MSPRGFRLYLKALRPLLIKWDPIGVYDTPDERPPYDTEYDCLAPAVAKLMYEGATDLEARQRLDHELHYHMGIAADDPACEKFLAHARQLWARIKVEDELWRGRS